jgi:hypothetical protein
MGRITQFIDFLTIKPLPGIMERLTRYSKINDEDTLKSLRKKLHLQCDDNNNDIEPDLFSQ